jgi:uncharacterized repeat protein (TIGR03803 family)
MSLGNLYGTTCYNGAYGFGRVFKLARSNGGWTHTSLHDFKKEEGGYLHGNIVFDAKGKLYGTASRFGPGNNGVIWEITH